MTRGAVDRGHFVVYTICVRNGRQPMDPVNMREARRRLSDLVRAAERGESTVITKRGREVARIVPTAPAQRKRLPDLTEFRASISVDGEPLSEAVARSRRESRY